MSATRIILASLCCLSVKNYRNLFWQKQFCSFFETRCILYSARSLNYWFTLYRSTDAPVALGSIFDCFVCDDQLDWVNWLLRLFCFQFFLLSVVHNAPIGEHAVFLCDRKRLKLPLYEVLEHITAFHNCHENRVPCDWHEKYKYVLIHAVNRGSAIISSGMIIDYPHVNSGLVTLYTNFHPHRNCLLKFYRCFLLETHKYNFSRSSIIYSSKAADYMLLTCHSFTN